MGHFQLREDGSSTMAEQLELSGSKSFYVSPNSKNETPAPIRGSAIVSILGKNYSIQLTHKMKDYEDPEPSSTKWSYVENLYISGTTPVPAADVKNQDTGYIRASRGKTVYNSIGTTGKVSTILISNAYTTAQAVLDRVGDFSDPSVGTSYNKGAIMTLFTFTMYYKYSTESGGTVIPPVDDGTPASNKARIPCRPDASAAPDWISNLSLLYQVNFTKGSGNNSRVFGTWADFIAFWDSIQTNPDYTNATFHYILQGSVAFNELLSARGGSGPITITEVDNGKGIGIHGAKPLYLVISQQEGKNMYGASMLPAETYMNDNEGNWYFPVPNEYELYSHKLGNSPDYAANTGTLRLTTQFRVDSTSENYKASPLSGLTGNQILNPIGGTTLEYQYVGQPFILKLYKENANGIEGVQMRPYYKKDKDGGKASLWESTGDLIGHQSFNPLKYENNNVYVRDGFQIISGPMSGNHGSIIFQLVPLVLYKQDGTRYSPTSSLVNYCIRYLNYQSAIRGSISTGYTYERLVGAFLKWPNPDGNNAPDHIDTQGDPENVPSAFGKVWESTISKDTNFSVIDRIMFVPVLWCNKRLEDNSDFRSWLSQPHFNMHLLSPNVLDTEIELNPGAVWRLQFTLNIEVKTS